VDLVPNPCDAVFGAQYCIKHTGRFEGLGEKTVDLSLGGSAFGDCNFDTSNLSAASSSVNSTFSYAYMWFQPGVPNFIQL
jgi:hypothetical protein